MSLVSYSGTLLRVGLVGVGLLGGGCHRTAAPESGDRGSLAQAAPTAEPSTVPLVSTVPAFADSASSSASAAETMNAMWAPENDAACPREFPLGYRFSGESESHRKQLLAHIWLDGRSRGENVVVIHIDDPRAADARCIAPGPHRDLNLQRWCCRARP